MHVFKKKNGGVRLSYRIAPGRYGWRDFSSVSEYREWARQGHQFPKKVA